MPDEWPQVVEPSAYPYTVGMILVARDGGAWEVVSHEDAAGKEAGPSTDIYEGRPCDDLNDDDTMRVDGDVARSRFHPLPAIPAELVDRTLAAVDEWFAQLEGQGLEPPFLHKGGTMMRIVIATVFAELGMREDYCVVPPHRRLVSRRLQRDASSGSLSPTARR
jgi:hypothetical protein